MCVLMKLTHCVSEWLSEPHYVWLEVRVLVDDRVTVQSHGSAVVDQSVKVVIFDERGDDDGKFLSRKCAWF